MAVNNPAISVVIPLYNKEKYIKRALESTMVNYLKPIGVEEHILEKERDEIARY